MPAKKKRGKICAAFHSLWKALKRPFLRSHKTRVISLAPELDSNGHTPGTESMPVMAPRQRQPVFVCLPGQILDDLEPLPPLSIRELPRAEDHQELLDTSQDSEDLESVPLPFGAVPVTQMMEMCLPGQIIEDGDISADLGCVESSWPQQDVLDVKPENNMKNTFVIKEKKSSQETLEPSQSALIRNPESRPKQGVAGSSQSSSSDCSWLKFGSVVSGYKVGRCIGKGSFGRVYLGFNIYNQDKVAIKYIPKRPDDRYLRVPLSSIEHEGDLFLTPPEVFTNPSFQAAPANIWQMGIVLYEVLYGFCPYFSKEEIINGDLQMYDGISDACCDLIRSPKQGRALSSGGKHRKRMNDCTFFRELKCSLKATPSSHDMILMKCLQPSLSVPQASALSDIIVFGEDLKRCSEAQCNPGLMVPRNTTFKAHVKTELKINCTVLMDEDGYVKSQKTPVIAFAPQIHANEHTSGTDPMPVMALRHRHPVQSPCGLSEIPSMMMFLMVSVFVLLFDYKCHGFCSAPPLEMPAKKKRGKICAAFHSLWKALKRPFLRSHKTRVISLAPELDSNGHTPGTESMPVMAPRQRQPVFVCLPGQILDDLEPLPPLSIRELPRAEDHQELLDTSQDSEDLESVPLPFGAVPVTQMMEMCLPGQIIEDGDISADLGCVESSWPQQDVLDVKPENNMKNTFVIKEKKSSQETLKPSQSALIRNPESRPKQGVAGSSQSSSSDCSWLKFGSVVSGYKVGRCIGKGSFGRVYLGFNVYNQDKVAIKYIPKRPDDRYLRVDGLSKPVLAELAILLRLGSSCQNVIQLDHWIERESCVIFFMEYPDFTTTLYGLIPVLKGDEDLARLLMLQLQEAVKYCVSRGVFHADMHSGNILVNEDNFHLKLLDFGCAQVVSSEPLSSIEHEGDLFLTPPEVFTNPSFQAAPANIWQMGIVLYEVLYGFCPYFSKEEIINGDLQMYDGISDGHTFKPRYDSDQVPAAVPVCPSSISPFRHNRVWRGSETM
ncbi:hypothetical protein DNTS_024411 [Danionella cerebrum]|uniref:non-specific serine/threonine protein kinase n=1 Tax=Danionella cerebrum TaxID=2873325 RepID=A0A553RH53_9TELE|nr:hypothetical protein DNTS_024411 [Danionella translucida]